MDFQKDFAELCGLLNAHSVEYLIVGGYAVAFHGAPRYTGDLDLLVCPDESVVTRMLRAAAEFGFPAGELDGGYILSHSKILELGVPPVQVHLMTKISGVDWDEAWASRVESSYGGVPVSYIGRMPLIVNKAAAARAKDLADVEALRRP